MSEIKNMSVALEKAKNPRELLAIDFVADRTIKNYQAVTGRKDGTNWYQGEVLAVMQIFAEKPEYQKADKMSIWGCLMTAGRLGLSIVDGDLDLIMYGNILKAEPNYKGMRNQLRRMESVKFINEAQVVYKGDTFVYDKLNLKIKEHVMGQHPSMITMDVIEAAYVRIEFTDGSIKDVVMFKPELISAKNKTKNTSSNGPWITWTSEMCKKTVLKRAKKIYYTKDPMEIGDDDLVTAPETTEDITFAEVKQEAPQQEPEMPITPTEEVKEQPKKQKAPAQKSNMSALLNDDE